MTALAKVAAQPFPAPQTTTKNAKAAVAQEHIIETPAGNMTYKRLIQNDAERKKNGKSALFSWISSIFSEFFFKSALPMFDVSIDFQLITVYALDFYFRMFFKHFDGRVAEGSSKVMGRLQQRLFPYIFVSFV